MNDPKNYNDSVKQNYALGQFQSGAAGIEKKEDSRYLYSDGHPWDFSRDLDAIRKRYQKKHGGL